MIKTKKQVSREGAKGAKKRQRQVVRSNGKKKTDARNKRKKNWTRINADKTQMKNQKQEKEKKQVSREGAKGAKKRQRQGTRKLDTDLHR